MLAHARIHSAVTVATTVLRQLTNSRVIIIFTEHVSVRFSLINRLHTVVFVFFVFFVLLRDATAARPPPRRKWPGFNSLNQLTQSILPWLLINASPVSLPGRTKSSRGNIS